MMPNANMMRQMQARLNKIQEELDAKTVEASAGGGAVTVVANGQLRVKSVTIDPEVVVDAEDVEMLQDLVTAAVNEALGKAQELAAQQLGALTGGLKLPVIVPDVRWQPRSSPSLGSSKSLHACRALVRRPPSGSRFSSCVSPKESVLRLCMLWCT